MAIRDRVAGVLDGQRGALFPWSAVAFGTGIGGYFTLRQEPGGALWVTVVLAGLVLVGVIWKTGLRAPLLIALALVLAGFGLAGWRAHAVSAPVLSFRYHGPIEGRIVRIDRSQSDKPRLTLDRVVLSRVPPNRTPERVRVSLHGEQGYLTPEPGLTVILTGHLSPPGGPVEPGGFDFQRQAWFQGLGAVGYTRSPVLALAPPGGMAPGLWIERVRMAVSDAVRQALPGRTGAFAAAILTGDRSAMDDGTLEALRLSNLAHLLAISGLHMGMLTGFVYAALRYGLAAVPGVALRWPIHKIGAAVALAAGFFYLLMSGGSVATERAFIMVSVMLVAILFDRRALTIRAVALAAMIVLAIRPEALLGPGFQMSFAATTVLIAVFQALRCTRLWIWHPVIRWGAALIVSSAVAGLATAPIAAAHFNRVPHFGLIANILSVPVMGLLVMPAAVLSALLAPFGLWHWGLRLMAPGIDWILGVADRVAGIEGTASHVATPPSTVLILLVAGALFAILWQGRARGAGLLPMMLAFLLWAGVERPDVLISGDGALVGVMTPEGRALSRERGSGFAASSWLENDGDTADQAQAFAREGFRGKSGVLSARLGDTDVVHLTGRGAATEAVNACQPGAILVARVESVSDVGDCTLFDQARLSETGPVAIWLRDGASPVTVTTRDRTGHRPWHRDAVQRQ